MYTLVDWLDRNGDDVYLIWCPPTELVPIQRPTKAKTKARHLRWRRLAVDWDMMRRMAHSGRAETHQADVPSPIAGPMSQATRRPGRVQNIVFISAGETTTKVFLPTLSSTLPYQFVRLCPPPVLLIAAETLASPLNFYP